MLTKIQNVRENNISFQALRVKNPQEMPTEMLRALLNVKDVFEKFPYASVKLHNSSRIGIDKEYQQGASGVCTRTLGRFLQSSLIFNLDDITSKLQPKCLVISSQVRHTGNSLFSIIEQIRDVLLPIRNTADNRKKENLKELTNKITKDTVSEKIEKLFKAEEDKNTEKLQRAELIRSLATP